MLNSAWSVCLGRYLRFALIEMWYQSASAKGSERSYQALTRLCRTLSGRSQHPLAFRG